VKQQVTLYGEATSWETERIRQHLDTLGISYRFVSVAGSERESALRRGERSSPTVHLANGPRSRTLGAPNETALELMLRRLGLLRPGSRRRHGGLALARAR
jgi:hypothetical protein